MLRKLVLALVLLISGTVFAQNQKELGDLMRNRGEYYFTLPAQNRSEIQEINKLCSVDKFDGKNVVCYANQKQYDKLLAAGYQPALQTPPSMLEEAKMWDGNRATYEWDSYPTYSQYESMMQGFPSSVVSGRTCTYMELGTLSSGRKVMGVRINNGSPAGKPKFLYSSTIHGDETTGWIMMLRLIDELCTSTDSRIVNLVNNLDIFIFPNTNPDGTYHGGSNSVTGATRANANGVDMNRHFKDFVNGAHPDGASSYEKEAQWMMDLAQAHTFTMAANYHGGAELMNYPYDCTKTYPADTDWWEYVCTQYVTLARQVYSSYMTDTYSDGVTNGASWYMIGGGRQDYMNYYAECREVTIECSSTKLLSASDLPAYWNRNHNSILTLMEQCLNGIHGVVRDAYTNQPIVGATVTVRSHESNNSQITSHGAGDFHRPIKGGSWTLDITKTGYNTKSVSTSVTDGNRRDLGNVYLTKSVTPSYTFEEGWNWWSPNADITLAAFENALGANGVKIMDKDGKYVTRTNNTWSGNLTTLVAGKMYKVRTNAACTVNVTGVSSDPTDHADTPNPGANYLGIVGSANKNLNQLFEGFTPTDGDYIKTQRGVSTYYQNYGGWRGSVTTLHPGEGFIYYSKASSK